MTDTDAVITSKKVAEKTVDCSRCKKVQPHSEFDRTQLARRLSRKSKATGNVGICKQCVRVNNRLKKYNLTYERFRELFEEQGGNCAMPFCAAPLDETSAQVDHDHTLTPIVVRGLLCKNCNTGVGKLKDRPETVLQALLYLARGTPEMSKRSIRHMRRNAGELIKWLDDIKETPTLLEEANSATSSAVALSPSPSKEEAKKKH